MAGATLPLTSTTMIVGALLTDVKVVETRRANIPTANDDNVHVQIATILRLARGKPDPGHRRGDHR